MASYRYGSMLDSEVTPFLDKTQKLATKTPAKSVLRR
jgi:hypothetical protein